MSEAGILTIHGAVRQQGLVRARVSGRKGKALFAILWLFTIAVYARPEDIIPQLAPLHLTFVLGCCAGIAYLVSLFSGMRVLWTAELGIVLALTAWFVLGLPFALWRGGSLQVLAGIWLKTLVIFFLLTQTLVTLERIRLLLWAIILSELVVTSFSIIESSKVIWVEGRMLGVNLGFLGWNFLGIAAAITIPYISALFVARRSLANTALLLATAICMLWMLVLTASRSGLLCVVLSVGLSLLLVLRTSFRGRLVGMFIAAVLFAALALAPKILWQRMETVWDTSSAYGDQVAASAEESKEDHIAVLERSIQYTLENPIFGLGLGNFQVASGTQIRQPGAWIGTHNTFTQLSSEAGIPALAMFLALLTLGIRNMRRVSRMCSHSQQLELGLMARATLASLISFAFGAFFAHLGYEYYFFYLVAITVGVRHVARSTKLEPAAVLKAAPVLQTGARVMNKATGFTPV